MVSLAVFFSLLSANVAADAGDFASAQSQSTATRAAEVPCLESAPDGGLIANGAYRAALVEQALGLRIEIENLRKERETHGVVLPIGMMAVGAFVILYSLVEGSGARLCPEHANDCPPPQPDWSSQVGNLFLGTVSAVGGGWLLSVQIRPLIDLNRQITAKTNELRMTELHLHNEDAAHGAGLSLRF